MNERQRQLLRHLEDELGADSEEEVLDIVLDKFQKKSLGETCEILGVKVVLREK